GAGLATLTGLNAGSDGEYKELCNFGPGSVLVTHADTGSSAANRFQLTGGASHVITSGTSGLNCMTFRYEGPNSFWLEVSGAPVEQSDGTVALSCNGTGSASCGVNTCSDRSGELVTGTGSTSCTVTFTHAYQYQPSCTVSSQSALTTNASYSISTSVLTIADVSALTGVHFNYHCDPSF
ncbi:MAG TPA: hypothetical protein VKT80_16670, partial [Chloroflexota bacterium]|nr:hypothetical protein [Chloroflexota bacterium]